MSEPMFPSAEAPAAAPAPGAPVASTGNRKALLAIGGAAAAVIVGGGAFFLLTSGGSAPAPSAVTALPQASAPAVAPSAAPSASPAVVRPATAAATSRDPFKPLFVAVVATDVVAAPSAAPAPPAAPIAAPTPAAKQVTLTVTKIDPVAQTATVGVDGKPYAVGVGKAFGTYFSVYSVFNASCVGVLYGDQSVPVCLTQPQTVSPA